MSIGKFPWPIIIEEEKYLLDFEEQLTGFILFKVVSMSSKCDAAP